jgi:hypothetical protein
MDSCMTISCSRRIVSSEVNGFNFYLFVYVQLPSLRIGNRDSKSKCPDNRLSDTISYITCSSGPYVYHLGCLDLFLDLSS